MNINLNNLNIYFCKTFAGNYIETFVKQNTGKGAFLKSVMKIKNSYLMSETIKKNTIISIQNTSVFRLQVYLAMSSNKWHLLALEHFIRFN